MQVLITGRRAEVPEGLRKYAEDRLVAVLSDRTRKVTRVTGVVDLEKNVYKADLVLYMKDHDLKASASGMEVNKVLDEAIDKLSAQLDKLLDKLCEHRDAPLRENEPPLQQ